MVIFHSFLIVFCKFTKFWGYLLQFRSKPPKPWPASFRPSWIHFNRRPAWTCPKRVRGPGTAGEEDTDRLMALGGDFLWIQLGIEDMGWDKIMVKLYMMGHYILYNIIYIYNHIYIYVGHHPTNWESTIDQPEYHIVKLRVCLNGRSVSSSKPARGCPSLPCLIIRGYKPIFRWYPMW